MKASRQNVSDFRRKQKRLHRWEKLVLVVRWLVEHQVPQTIIKAVIWLASTILEG